MDPAPSAPVRLLLGPNHVLDLARNALVDTAGARLELRPQALSVLVHRALHAARVVTKDELLAAVWPGMVVTDDSLVLAIGDIRRALGDVEHQIVQTVPRRGYLLVAKPPAPSPAVPPVAPGTVPRPASKRQRFAPSVGSIDSRGRWSISTPLH